MPKRFMWRGADVYVPIPFERGRIVEGVRNVHLLGRLKPGISDAAAEADLTPIIADLKKREPGQFPDQFRVGIVSFAQTFPSSITRDIWILLGAVALLLLISCANVSNLLLSRAASRQREITVRAALGASRRRIVSQMLVESLILALLAGVLGTALAYAGLPAILALVPPDTIPDESEIALNTPVLFFALAVSAATSILCGLAPALHSSGRDFATAMREVNRSLAGSSRQAILRKTLVVAEVALSLMLLAGSSVLLRAYVAMQHVELAAPPDRVLTMRVPLPAARYPDAPKRIAFFQDLMTRIAAVPGVAAAGLNTGLHPLGNMWTPVAVSGEAPNTEPVQVHSVNAGYAHALGIRLAQGRLFTDSDVVGAQHVALVNEQFARGRVNGRDPLGQTVTIPRLKDPPFSLANHVFQIVGVVHDSRNNGLVEGVMPEVYVPFSVTGVSNLVAVRTHGNPADSTRAIVEQVYAIDRSQPVTSVMTLEQILKDDQYATPRFNLVLLSIFAGVGLALAVVGVYGVMSSAVAQETPEIGVRMALGASAGAIAAMVIGRGLRLVGLGAALGLIGSYAIGRWLAGQVWNVSSFDPIAFGAVAAILILAGLQACAWPALRAARIDPIRALRTE
jgi:predicted permease